MTQQQIDSYADAAAKAIGRLFANVFLGMVEAGMKPADALVVTTAYAAGMAGARNPESKERK